MAAITPKILKDNKKKKLSEAIVGSTVCISENQSFDLPVKFEEMGLSTGTWVEIRNKAIANGPVCVCIKDTDMLVALRMSEAKNIDIHNEK